MNLLIIADDESAARQLPNSRADLHISCGDLPVLFHGHQHLNQETVVGATRVIGIYGFRQVVIPA